MALPFSLSFLLTFLSHYHLCHWAYMQNRVRGGLFPTKRGYNESHANRKGEEIWLGSTYTVREFLLLFYGRIVVITRYTNRSGLKSMKEVAAAATRLERRTPSLQLRLGNRWVFTEHLRWQAEKSGYHLIGMWMGTWIIFTVIEICVI